MHAHLVRADDVRAAGLWNAVGAARLFDSREAYEAFRATSPWAVLASSRGEAAVLDRWRDHLRVMSVRGLWCSRGRVPALLADLASTASEQGFDRILSPVLAEPEAFAYERAGMTRLPELLSYRHGLGGRMPEPVPPAGVSLRRGDPRDLEALLELDAACFDDFWRYDRRHVELRLGAGQVTVAEGAGGLLGYTQRATRGAACALGRVAVSAGARRAGVGTALVADALARARSEGASLVSLSTHEHNSAARRLYARAGFVQAPGRLVLLMARA